MRNKMGVVLAMGLGTMLYCTDFLIRTSPRITQEALVRHVERLLSKTIDMTQSVADVQRVLLKVFPLIAEGSLSQATRKELAFSMTRLERELSECQAKLASFVGFIDKQVVSVPEKKNTK